MKILIGLLFIFSFSALGQGVGLESLCTEIISKNSASDLENAGVINSSIKKVYKDKGLDKSEEKLQLSKEDTDIISHMAKLASGAIEGATTQVAIKNACDKAAHKVMSHKGAQRLNKLFKKISLYKEAFVDSENDRDFYGKKDMDSTANSSELMTESSGACKSRLDLNGSFGENCSRLPSKVTDHSGDSSDQTFSLLDQFSLVYSRDITSLSGSPDDCSKCLEKFSQSDKAAEELSNGYKKAEKEIVEIFHEKVVQSKLQLLIAASENIHDFKASRIEFADKDSTQKKCIDQKLLESKISASCSASGKNSEIAKKRISKAMKSIGIIGALEDLQGSIENSARKIKIDACKDSYSSKDVYQNFLMNEMYAPPISEGETTLGGVVFELVDRAIETSDFINGFCNLNSRKGESVDVLFSTVFFKGMFGDLKEATKIATEKLNKDLGYNYGVSNDRLAAFALEKMRKSDPLLRLALDDGESFCRFLEKKPKGASIATLVRQSDEFSSEELFNNHKEILDNYENKCISYVDTLVEAACSADEGIGALTENILPEQVKELMDERLDQIHLSDNLVSDEEKSEVLGLGKMSCQISSMIGGDDDGGVFKPLDAKGYYESGQISKSEMSDLFRKELNKKMNDKDFKKTESFLDYKGELFCEGSNNADAARQHVINDLYGVEPNEEIVVQQMMEDLVENGSENSLAYIPNSVARKISRGISPSSILNEMKDKRRAREMRANKTISPVANSGSSEFQPKSVFSERQVDPMAKQQVSQAYVNPGEFIQEVKQLEEEEKLIEELISGDSTSEQLAKSLKADKTREQQKLDDLNRQLEQMEKKIAEAKRAEELRKAKKLEDEKKKIESEIASTQKNIDFLDKETQKLAERKPDEKIKTYERAPASVIEPVSKAGITTGQSRLSAQQNLSTNEIVKSVNNQINGQTNFIKLEVAPSEILSLIKNVEANGIDTLFVGENKSELRFIKFPGQTNYIDVRLLDEETLKELYKKLDLDQIVKAGSEAKEKIKKIKEEAGQQDNARKVLFENLTAFIKSSVASGNKQAAAIAAREMLK